jgi:hypothetical protein
MIHGLDIPLEEQQPFAKAAEKSKALLASLGVELIPLATNFRQLPLDWENAFGTALASCLMLLQGGYTTGLIASSFPYQALSFPMVPIPSPIGCSQPKHFKSFMMAQPFRAWKKWGNCPLA